MPYCPICEKCLCSTGRKGTNISRKFTLGSNLRKHKALTLSGRDQKDKDSSKFGGGIVSTKCGHLFHQNCLNDYITNFRTKGDCYGTTYNVLCPLCGANLSNGKTLKIDIEAHFGVLEEFFQDLCKLKYMNKELKRTLELEWSDIGDLEKKIEQAKTEYEHAKNLKRSNEQRCVAQEERIAKAIEDASTCYRYREIEKQLLDENINLEAVARRMETIISSKLRPKVASSTTTIVSSADNESDKEDSASTEHDHYKTMIDNAVNTMLSSESATEEDSRVSRRLQAKGSQRLQAKGQVDISVQISVRSEWSLNSAGEVGSETVLHKRCSHEERLQLCSSSSVTSEHFLDHGEPFPLKFKDNDINNNILQRTQVSMAEPVNVQELSTKNKIMDGRIMKDSNSELQKSMGLRVSSEVDKSKSYTVRIYPQNHLAISGSLTKRQEVNNKPQSCSHVSNHAVALINKEDAENSCLSYADKSRSYTIKVHNPKTNQQFKEIVPHESDKLVQEFICRQDESEAQIASLKHKPPAILTCRQMKKNISKIVICASEKSLELVTVEDRKYYDEKLSNQQSYRMQIDRENMHHNQIASLRPDFNDKVDGGNKEDKLIELQDKQSESWIVTKKDACGVKPYVITPPNTFASESHKQIQRLNSIIIVPPPPPLEFPSSECKLSLNERSNEVQMECLGKDNETYSNKSHVRNETASPIDPLELFVLPPPPQTDMNLCEKSGPYLAVPPPPPMTARPGETSFSTSCCQTPESTRKLIDSLLRPSEINMPASKPPPRPPRPCKRGTTKKKLNYPNAAISPVDCFTLPPPPPIQFEGDSEDELLKSVIRRSSQAASFTPAPAFLDKTAETGAGDVREKPRHGKGSIAEEVAIHPISSVITPAKVPSIPSNQQNCLAAERFARDARLQNSLPSSLQSVKVGAEPAEDNHHQGFQKRHVIIETTGNYFNPTATTSRCMTPRNHHSLYGTNDHRCSSNYYSNYWGLQHPVCTPIVVEHEPEHFPNRGDFITPESSYTGLLLGSNGNTSHSTTTPSSRWLADTKIFHDPHLSHHINFYPNNGSCRHEQNFP